MKNHVTRVLVVNLLLAGFLIGLVQAQAMELEWKSVLNRIKDKYDGYEKEIKDIEITSSRIMIAEQGTMKSEMVTMNKGDKFRVDNKIQMEGEMEAEGMSEIITTIIHDGVNTWMISPFAGTQKLPNEKFEQEKDKWNWWEFLSEETKLIGTDKVCDRDCYIVELQSDEEEYPFTKMWLDQKSLVMVQAESIDDQGNTIKTINSDFRKFKGDWEMGYKMEMFMGDQLFMSQQIEEIKVNSGLSDDLFIVEDTGSQGMDINKLMEMMKKGEGE
ncbi:outer membrane lipoprotein-sorting protein [bacterium]|nr:outer membrane lipoprotein-sorting protein [bacterium]